VLVLVRHGQSTANAAGLLAGRTDFPLTDEGRAQARALSAVLGPVRRVISSPLRRAVETAEAMALGLPVEIDDRWLEVDYGEHEGRPLPEVPPEAWRRWRTERNYRPEGGEALADVGQRVRAACRELFSAADEGARAPEGDVLVVSHVSPIKSAVAWALDADDTVAWRMYLANASLTRIGWGAEGPVLHTFNQVVAG
jgi:probable phosphoglycerate mutase